MCVALRGLENLGHRSHQAAPLAFFCLELLAASFCELVIFGAAIVLGGAPLRFDPAASFQPVQCRVQRTLLHLQYLVRYLLYASGYRPTMLRP